ncbi:MAG: RNA-directed DNA polymerase [Oscillospiraceae bacterium]|nr:RNA-directed DNA polymerase [Oscillospiraceae bacterium]
MRWYPSGKLNFTAADLAVLSHPAFASKPWAGAGAWLRADPAYPPIPSALVFSLLAGPRESRPERMWKQYRKLLEIANDPAQYYVSHEIVQHRKPRTISAPFYELAQYQRWILKNILERAPTTDFAFAYKKGLTLADNARVHLGRSVIVKLDLVHFFDSITFGMVYEVFAGQLRYPQETAVLLANLCCLNGRLPQGACTSPYLSNLCFAKADGELAGYCREKGLAYSRYSDDLTFSGDRIDVKELIAFVRETVKKYGFSLNYRKIHVDGKGRRHRVTGIVCNEKLNAGADYRRKVRQEIYYLRKYGAADHLRRRNDPAYRNADGTPCVERYYAALLGRISFILQVDPEQEEFWSYRDYVRDLMLRAAE